MFKIKEIKDFTSKVSLNPTDINALKEKVVLKNSISGEYVLENMQFSPSQKYLILYRADLKKENFHWNFITQKICLA